METKAHSRDAFRNACQISRIEEDLLECSRYLASSCSRVLAHENSTDVPNNTPCVCIVHQADIGGHIVDIIVWSIIADAFRYSNEEYPRIYPKTSLKDFFVEKVSNLEYNLPDSASSPFFSFAHFLHPTYSPNNQKSWTLELKKLSSSANFGDHAQPTLLFTIFGPCAAYITSSINDLYPSSTECFNFLDDFFRPYYPLFLNYTPYDPNFAPKAALATNWQNDPLAGCGSYMNFQVSKEASNTNANTNEEVKLEENIRMLRSGLPERGVWLVGEHTAPFVALGMLTGDYWSGEAVAMKILMAHGLMKGPEQQEQNNAV